MKYALLCLLLVGCAGMPKPPVGIIKALNTKPQQALTPYALEFNLETDFNADLKLKDGVTGTRKPITLDDLNRNWCMDAAAKGELTRYALQWKERYLMIKKQLERCEQGGGN